MDFPLQAILGGRTRRPMPGDPDYEAWAAAQQPQLYDLGAARLMGEAPWEKMYTPDVDAKFKQATAGVAIPNDPQRPASPFMGPSLPGNPMVLPAAAQLDPRPLLAPGAVRNPSPLEMFTNPGSVVPMPPPAFPYSPVQQSAIAATPQEASPFPMPQRRGPPQAIANHTIIGPREDAMRILPGLLAGSQAQANQFFGDEAAYDREITRGEYGVREAEARRKDVLNNKLVEMGMLAAEALGPEATPGQRKAKVAETLGLFSGFAGGPRALEAPQSTEVQDIARNRIGRIFSGKDAKTPFAPSDQSARSLLDAIGISDGQDREASIAEAVSRAKAHPQMTDELVKILAGDLTRVAPLENDEYGGLPSQYVDKKYGMPFNLAQDKGYGALLGRAPGLLTGNTEAFYNRAVLPDGRVVTLPASAMGGMLSRANQSPEQRQAAERRLAAGKLLLERLTNQGK
jgi:hypothetical protein